MRLDIQQFIFMSFDLHLAGDYPPFYVKDQVACKLMRDFSRDNTLNVLKGY